MTPGKATVADTSYGKVRGFITPDGVRTFRGIPYGASTAGANRFKPPVKPDKWTGERDATQFGSKSPQVAAAGQASTIMYLDYTEGGLGRQGEDCLDLNVWTKGSRDGGKRPVMVRIHGGGFSTGTSSHPMYWGHASARRDVVFVSVNHRLGSLGYLDLSSVGGPEYAHSANAGMLDLVAALEWVRDNIEKFGGDPGNVTIAGESGGGMKVSFLCGMPPAKGLFHRAIVESGSALTAKTPAYSKRVLERFLSRLGLSGSKSDIAKLQQLPVNRLLEADVMMDSRFYPEEPAAGGFAPVVDGDVLPRGPFDPDANPLAAAVPMLIGYNQDEGTFLLQGDEELYALDEAKLKKRVIDHYGANADRIIGAYRKTYPYADSGTLMNYISRDVVFGNNAMIQAERHAQAGKAATYMYRFAWKTPGFNGKYGATHGAEISMVNGDPSHMDVLTHSTPEAEALAVTVNGAWLAFARAGDPNSAGLPHWEAYNTNTRSTMFLDTQSKLLSNPDLDIRQLLQELKPASIL
jgi:para-nitrobenzyl esterase